MEILRRHFLQRLSLALPAIQAVSAKIGPPAPYGPVPSARQLSWQSLEFYNFLHFTINTFTNKEWGYGDESPALFNPTEFNAYSIVSNLKAAGSKGVILTCKHHDGFCLWPTQTTQHSIKYSPYKNGKGDIVREISEAAHRNGLKFGVYCSPWDRNNPYYGKPEYVEIYRQQLRELLTHYGPVFEIWHDGANGGDGYYGGAREKRIIDKRHYYHWHDTWDMERRLQPNAVIFSDVGPDIRWVGNEKGIAGETCWATFTPLAEDGKPGAPGDVNEKASVTGTRNGADWMPAECDVSIRPGWFWHESENSEVKTPRQLLDLYFTSVGRGASFLLNVPPDRRGLLYEKDVESLKVFGDLIRSLFAKNLAVGAKATASNVRSGDPAYSAQNLLDGNPDTYWATDDSITTPHVVLDLPQPVSFNTVRLREHTQLGQRISECAVDYWRNGDWATLDTATSIGICRLMRTTGSLTTSRVRLRIMKSPVAPALSEFSLYATKEAEEA